MQYGVSTCSLILGCFKKRRTQTNLLLQDVLSDVLSAARYVTSICNSQPWAVTVIQGEARDKWRWLRFCWGMVRLDLRADVRSRGSSNHSRFPRKRQGPCSVWEDLSTVRYQCLLRSNVWNKPINFWNPGHPAGLSVALAEAVESHAGLFRCRKQWWPKLLDTKRCWFVCFCKGCRPFVDEFYIWIFFELHFLLQPWSGSLLKNDWLEIRGLSCDSSFQLLKVHEENWNSAVPDFKFRPSWLIHLTKCKAFAWVGWCTYPWNPMNRWNEMRLPRLQEV